MINKDKLNEEIKRLKDKRKDYQNDFQWGGAAARIAGEIIGALNIQIDTLESIYNCLD